MHLGFATTAFETPCLPAIRFRGGSAAIQTLAAAMADVRRSGRRSASQRRRAAKANLLPLPRRLRSNSDSRRRYGGCPPKRPPKCEPAKASCEGGPPAASAAAPQQVRLSPPLWRMSAEAAAEVRASEGELRRRTSCRFRG